MKLNYWIVFCGGDALANPPALVGVEAPSEAVITLTAEKFTFELEQSPEAAADLRLVVCASAPQGNGITRAYGKAAIVGGPLPISTSEIDIKAAYDEKNGAPSAAAPKVFMKSAEATPQDCRSPPWEVYLDWERICRTGSVLCDHPGLSPPSE